MTASLSTLWYVAAGDRGDDDFGVSGDGRRSETRTSVSGIDRPIWTDADAEVLVRLHENDETTARAAFTEMYRAHLPGLVALAERYLGSAQLAEDVVADVFVALWHRHATWTPRYGIRAYLYRVVRTRSLDQLRNADTAQRLGDIATASGDSPAVSEWPRPIDEAVEEEQVLERVAAAIATFPPLRRHVMELRWQHGFSIDDIAAILGVRRSAVDQHLSRGLRTLRRLLPKILGE